MTNKNDFSKDGMICEWQAIAIRLDPDYDIQNYFQKSSKAVKELAEKQPKRFLPIVMLDAQKCAKCKKAFHWESENTIAYIPDRWGYWGEDMPEEEAFLFLLDIPDLSDIAICKPCQLSMVKRYHAIRYCLMAARRREKLESEQA
jgi:hypothetical protein